ncbi:MAG: glycosyltransferase [Rhodothermales bacterium]
MKDLIESVGITADLNVLGTSSYDIAIVHWARPEIIRRVLEHSPEAHLGVLNPGYLGYPRSYIEEADPEVTFQVLDSVVANVDFFIVTGIMWRDMLLPFGRRVYETIDYITDAEDRPLKKHSRTHDLVIGYHGNDLHYAEDFFPHGAAALHRLASEHDFRLKVVVRNPEKQPVIDGVRTELIAWELESYERHLQSFDIGVCPVFSSLDQLINPFTYIRNPNRVNTLLAYGIPSVTSPVVQSCHDLQHGETTLFAVTEAGWYEALKQLIVQPELRNRIGHRGRAMVEQRFSSKVAADRFIAMLEEEIIKPLVPKPGFERMREERPSTWTTVYSFARRRLTSLVSEVGAREIFQ